MYLSELRPEQKELFLDLGICISKGDGSFDDSERIVLSEMCREMGIPQRIENRLGFDEALVRIKETASTREKRVILIEAAGIILADGVYSEEEKGLVKRISEVLEIEYKQCEYVLRTVRDLFEVYDRLAAFLACDKEDR